MNEGKKKRLEEINKRGKERKIKVKKEKLNLQ